MAAYDRLVNSEEISPMPSTIPSGAHLDSACNASNMLEHLVMQANGFINAVPKLVAHSQVLWREPATYPFGLHVGIQPLSEILILARITNKAGVELDRTHCANQRLHIHNERFGNTGIDPLNLAR